MHVGKNANAHPVTFKNGLATYSTFQPGMVRVSSNYTFHRRAAVGVTYLRLHMPDDRRIGTLGQLNLLLYRFNGAGSQGNVYVMGGGGALASSDDSGKLAIGEAGPVYFGSIQSDFETRTIYTALQGSVLAQDDAPTAWARYRLGLAPYVANYGELQTWLVGQIMWFPDMEDHLNVTPLMRFFYRTVLWELGADLQGRPWIQLMAHF